MIIMSGTFFPVHQGHINAIETGADIAESRNYVVVAKYFAVQFESKLRKRCSYDKEFKTTDHRKAMVDLVSTPQDVHGSFNNPKACIRNMVKKLHPDAHCFVVVGSDKPSNSEEKDGVTWIVVQRGFTPSSEAFKMPKETLDVTATGVRETLAGYPIDEALYNLRNVLPPPIAKYLNDNPALVDVMIQSANERPPYMQSEKHTKTDKSKRPRKRKIPRSSNFEQFTQG